jgi:hypothetical protein
VAAKGTFAASRRLGGVKSSKVRLFTGAYPAADSNSFMLVVAAKIPSEGGAGSFPLPPHRAVLLARKTSFPSIDAGAVTNVKITSYPLDEIDATVLT